MRNPLGRLNDLFDAVLGPADGAGPGIAPDLGDICRDEAASSWLAAARRSVSVTASDGTELLGWFVDQWNGRHDYLVACHGYRGRPSDMAGFARHAYERGLKVLLPAARGHERNAGCGPIQMGWRDSADLVAWVRALSAADPEARVALAGVSMGGAEVMMASGRADLPGCVRCVVEDCGFTSVWDEARHLAAMLGLPARGPAAVAALSAADALVRARAGFGLREASALRQVRRARVPVLFVHGTEDDFVPFRMLDELYGACAAPGSERLAVAGAGHAQSVLADPARYWGAVDAFIARHLA